MDPQKIARDEEYKYKQCYIKLQQLALRQLHQDENDRQSENGSESSSVAESDAYDRYVHCGSERNEIVDDLSDDEEVRPCPTPVNGDVSYFDPNEHFMLVRDRILQVQQEAAIAHAKKAKAFAVKYNLWDLE